MRSLARWRHYLRLRFDAVSGRVDAAGRRLAERIEWPDWRSDRPTVLYLARSTFNKDVEQMRRRGTFNWARIGAAKVKRVQEDWIAPEFRRQTFFYNFLQTELSAERGYVEGFAFTFLREACSVHPVDAVLVGNTDYWQDEVIKIACGKLGIPFLVLGRENYSMEIDAINVGRRFRDAKFAFKGTAVAVYSEATRRTMIESGAFRADQVRVTGAPRLDHWLSVKQLHPDQRRTIVLLNYAENYLAPENFKEVARAFIAAARSSRASVTFALKSKKLNEEEFARRLIPEFNDAPIEFISSQPLHELYPACRAVIGVNSLAVVEGFLSELAVIVPNWGDAKRDPAESMLDPQDPEDAKVAYYPSSTEELGAMFQACAEDRLPPKGTPAERRARFCKHIALPDEGTCSEQVEKFILHYIGEARAERERNRPAT